jgi:hypothetical protein
VFQSKYRYLFILALTGYSFANIFLTIGTDFLNFPISRLALFITLGAVIFGVWELTRLIEKVLARFSANHRYRIYHLLLLFLASIPVVAAVSLCTLQVLYYVVGLQGPIRMEHLKLLVAFGFRVNLFMHCVNAIYYYMQLLRKSELDSELLKKKTIEAQFEALRAQINPHFLFNCFNVLSSLVYKDADTSAKFIGQLSNVYRYLLFNQGKKIVPLSEELEFLNSYLYLIKIRFGENIFIENLLSDSKGKYVAPAVLQMLIENAIKHNVVSKKFPLTIRLFFSDHFITVYNSIQPKSVVEPSTKTGLLNIIERYKFLSDKEVVVEKNDEAFIVTLPVLYIENVT